MIATIYISITMFVIFMSMVADHSNKTNVPIFTAMKVLLLVLGILALMTT